jgi:hypothetical protein
MCSVVEPAANPVSIPANGPVRVKAPWYTVMIVVESVGNAGMPPVAESAAFQGMEKFGAASVEVSTWLVGLASKGFAGIG